MRRLKTNGLIAAFSLPVLACATKCLLISALAVVLGIPTMAQEVDSIQECTLNEIVVAGRMGSSDRHPTPPVVYAGKDFLLERFSGNLIQTIEHQPGIQAMSIGFGFAKPMIRGLGFSRIAVVENGIKQEGQQWGADHGLEIDAFNVESATIRKGPLSLLYGSDAMGGVIEIVPAPAPIDNQVYGSAALLAKSVNETLGGSLLVGLRKDQWHTRIRFSEQMFGDYRVPVDTVVFLTQRMPVYGRRLKNTAGREQDVSVLTEYRNKNYFARFALSDVFQKTGFFPGAHGIPSLARLQPDGDNRNIDLPFSTVNHLKINLGQRYLPGGVRFVWDVAFQQNHRKEFSLFHTHYGAQSPPETDPNKELEFRLSTLTSSLKAEWMNLENLELTVGWDTESQKNKVDGYSFLLPRYRRLTAGGYALGVFHTGAGWSFSGGIRFDYGELQLSPYRDAYLEAYLRTQAYPEEVIAAYRWRSYPVDRHFGDFSGSVALNWAPGGPHRADVHLGRSFRLPGANELASNGMHHGSFRHEQGDASLDSEQGWQLDAAYSYDSAGVGVLASPFFSWFKNYIYLKPTGEWSILPHAGQLYRYTGTEALFAGVEASLRLALAQNLTYWLDGEYVYTYNVHAHTPLSFSPPTSVRNALSWEWKSLLLRAEIQSIATQNRVDRNEDRTPGAHLVHLSARFCFPLCGNVAQATLSIQNLLNTLYFNHLSFYRKIEVPEPGRNIQLSIHLPFNFKFK
jgi:iron complex outermembrane receptor protein